MSRGVYYKYLYLNIQVHELIFFLLFNSKENLKKKEEPRAR